MTTIMTVLVAILVLLLFVIVVLSITVKLLWEDLQPIIPPEIFDAIYEEDEEGK